MPAQQSGGAHASGQGGDHGTDRCRSHAVGIRAGYPDHRVARAARGVVQAVRPGCARLTACRRSDQRPPPTTGCPSDSTPRRCSDAPPGSACSARGPSPAWPPRHDLEVSAFAVSWRRRQGIAERVPAGVATGQRPMPARPLHAAWARTSGAARSSGSSAAATSCTAPTSSSPRPGRAARVVTVHDLTVVRFPELCDPPTLAYPGAHPPGRGRRGLGAHAVPRSWPTRWSPSSASTRSGCGPSTTACPHARRPAADGGRGAVRPAPAGLRPLRPGRRHRRAPQGLPAAGPVVRRRGRPSTLTWRWSSWAATGGGSGAFDRGRGGSPARDRIVRPGYLDDAALAGALDRPPVLAYPSRYEGFGFPPLQAMAAGVPVVATAAGAVPEVVGDGALAGRTRGRRRPGRRAWSRCWTEAPRSTRWWRGARRRSGAFSWEACAEGLADLYRRRRVRSGAAGTAEGTGEPAARPACWPSSSAGRPPGGSAPTSAGCCRASTSWPPPTHRSAPELSSGQPGAGGRARPTRWPAWATRCASRRCPAAADPGLGPRPACGPRPASTSSTPRRWPPWSRASAPLVVTVHDLLWRRVPEAYPARGRRWHEAALRRALRRADHFVVPADVVAADLVEAGAVAGAVTVIPLGSRPPAATRRAGRPPAHLARSGCAGRSCCAWGPSSRGRTWPGSSRPTSRSAGDAARAVAAGHGRPRAGATRCDRPRGGPGRPGVGHGAGRPLRVGPPPGLRARSSRASASRRSRRWRSGTPVVASPLPSTGGAALEVDPNDIGVDRRGAGAGGDRRRGAGAS